jgi:hypothetical protein
MMLVVPAKLRSKSSQAVDGWLASTVGGLLTLLIHILRVANRIQHLTSIDDSSSRPASLFNNKEQCEKCGYAAQHEGRPQFC